MSHDSFEKHSQHWLETAIHTEWKYHSCSLPSFMATSSFVRVWWLKERSLFHVSHSPMPACLTFFHCRLLLDSEAVSAFRQQILQQKGEDDAADAALAVESLQDSPEKILAILHGITLCSLCPSALPKPSNLCIGILQVVEKKQKKSFALLIQLKSSTVILASSVRLSTTWQ